MAREPEADGRPDNPNCRWCGKARAVHGGGLVCGECDMAKVIA